jgi:3-oxoacyl-[acyl-carrier protein] reductase
MDLGLSEWRVLASASEPRADHVISNVSKSGVAALAKSLSREVADDGILVNCVAPGRLRSAQMDRAFADEQARERFSDANIPLRRFGKPEEVVPVTLLLGSPRNTYITGQTVGVDGGMAWSL